MSNGRQGPQPPRENLESGFASDRSQPLLRPEAVARFLACSPKTVYAWAASGLLPSIRLGRLVRFRPADVQRFVEAHAEARERGIHGSGVS
jgi:excisionase family DNA binding protein